MPKLIHTRDGKFQREWILKPGNLLIGRHPDCNICVDDTTVSGRHAMITVRPSAYLEGLLDVFIEDTNSTNGTIVNGKKVSRHMLKHGEVAHLGGHDFTFIDEATRGFETTTVILPDAD